jgi:iron complex transport system permease protein
MTRRLWCVLLMLAVLLILLGLTAGSAGLAPWRDMNPVARQIVLDIRLPRTLGAAAAGSLFGLAGAVAQGVFRNPLADPFLLGSASGASLGVALWVALGGAAGGWAASGWAQRLGLSGAAFVGAMAAVLLTLVLSRGLYHTVRLLLAGVVVGVVLGALTQLVMVTFPQSLQTMQGFMLGSTAFLGWGAVGVMAAVWCVCGALAAGSARVLDALTLGEVTARSLGLPLGPLRLALLFSLALATGTAVAQTGMIAFVGLGAPHLVRSLVKTTHGPLLGLASAMGAVLLLAADLLARCLLAPQELPVGVLTAALGGGYLLSRLKARD